MKKLTWFAAIMLIFALVAQVSAAPLFPDVKANHWAADAVAQLAAKGIVEGYPDGTFKGDRAATRWETALIVARLLAKDEQMWATFATKEDLEALKQLVNQLKDELDALGVRVTNLEDNVGKLTKRVWDLEKIRFYGSVDTIALTQGFQFTGATNPWDFATVAQAAAYNANNAVGSTVGASMQPNGFAVLNQNAAPLAGAYTGFPVIDYRNGVPLTNGTSFTMTGILGTKIRVSDDVDGGVEFAAYSRMGDQTVGAYYGTVPPYLSNIFTTDTSQTQTTLRTGAFTKLSLDNAWILHKPSGVKVQLGSFASTYFDPEVLYGEVNPNINGSRTLPFFGFRVAGDTQFLTPMRWEVMGTKNPNNQPGAAIAAATVYNTISSGFSLDWTFKGGDFKINFLRTADDYFGGTALTAGGQENPFAWQNPVAYYAASVPTQAMRPVQAGDGANGLIGPQAQSIWGASIRYEFPNNIKFEGVYGGSQYKPNMNSSYSRNGVTGRAKLSGSFFKNLLDLAVEYAGTSAYYDPFILPYQQVASLQSAIAYAGNANMSWIPEPFWRLGQFAYIPGFYQLHNSEINPNNRQGFRVFAAYHLPSGHGNVMARYQAMQQVGFSATQVQGGLLDMPGFVEPFFPGMTGGETTRGNITNLMLGADYKFPGTKLYAKASYDYYRLSRPSSLTGVAAAATNNVNIAEGMGKIFLSYPTNDKFLLKAGYDFTTFVGAYRSGFRNWDYVQNIPYIGFDYKLSDNTMWSLLAEGYTVTDRVSTANLGTNAPFQWTGSRLFTEFKVSF